MDIAVTNFSERLLEVQLILVYLCQSNVVGLGSSIIRLIMRGNIVHTTSVGTHGENMNLIRCCCRIKHVEDTHIVYKWELDWVTSLSSTMDGPSVIFRLHESHRSCMCDDARLGYCSETKGSLYLFIKLQAPFAHSNAKVWVSYSSYFRWKDMSQRPYEANQDNSGILIIFS
jgi:hypothetical protein